MHRIDNSTAVAVLPAAAAPGTPGYWTDGDPVGGAPATVMDRDWFNSVQEEIIAVLVAAGITPDKATRSQLLQAIQRLPANRAYAEYRTFVALTAAIPVDDTIPQISEGTQILSVTLTPRSLTSRIRLRYSAVAACDSVGVLGFSSALFVNGAPDAVRSTTVTIAANLQVGVNHLEHEYVPGTLSAQTFAIRVGAQNGLLYLNGSTTRYFGGTSAAVLLAEEIPA